MSHYTFYKAALPTYKGAPIAIDFDGTCVAHEFPDVGPDIGAAPVLRKLVDAGAQLILFTMRSGNHLQEAVDWFEANDIPLAGVQLNPTQKEWTSSPKAYAALYIDDAALGCPLRSWPGTPRPVVDWEFVDSMLFPTSKSK